MILPITTAVLLGVIALLTFLCTKLLAILVGALLLYFCPVIFLLFAAGAAVVVYRKRIMRKVVSQRRLK